MANDTNDTSDADDVGPGAGKPEASSSGAPRKGSSPGRPAKRRVDLPGSAAGAGGASSSGGKDGRGSGKPPARRTVTKRPFYKRGGFWFLVIVAEVVVALTLSVRLEPTIDTIDVDGGNPTAFCDLVKEFRTESSSSTQGSITVERAPDYYRGLQEKLRRLSAVAPPSLQYDIDKIIKGYDHVIVVAEQQAERKRVDAGYLGALAEIGNALNSSQTKYKAAYDRLNLTVLKQCNIDLTVEPPLVPGGSTTLPSVPGTPGGSTPGSTPATAAPGTVPAAGSTAGSTPATTGGSGDGSTDSTVPGENPNR